MKFIEIRKKKVDITAANIEDLQMRLDCLETSIELCDQTIRGYGRSINDGDPYVIGFRSREFESIKAKIKYYNETRDQLDELKLVEDHKIQFFVSVVCGETTLASTTTDNEKSASVAFMKYKEQVDNGRLEIRDGDLIRHINLRVICD